MSVRYSFQRPTVFEPGNYADGVFGGPYQGGFVGTGVNTTQSVGRQLDADADQHAS